MRGGPGWVADVRAVPVDCSPAFPDRLSWEHKRGVAQPWNCRLRLHDWGDRENPETHEHCEVCLRCNAYREGGMLRRALVKQVGAGWRVPAAEPRRWINGKVG
jgi:hypothetical protein